MAASVRAVAGFCAAMLPALMLAACNAALGERVQEDFHQAVAAGSAPAVHLENIAGSVRVEAWSRPIVDVEATKYGNDTRDVRSITIDVRKEPGQVSIVTSYAPGEHGGGVRYRISVPADASLRIGNVAGAVDLSGVRGNVDVETQAGEITADVGDVSGSRAIGLRATTGAITLTIAPGSSARVEATSTVGDFSSDVPGIARQRENLVGARGGGTIGSGSGQIRLSTTTGAIALRLGRASQSTVINGR